MKVIEAVWEKRNLGVSCVEVETDKNDEVSEVIRTVEKRQEQYQVIKVPSGRVDILLALQEKNFYYIESSIETGIYMKTEPIFPKQYHSIINRLSGHIAKDDEVQKALEIVESGEMFATDRIGLDPEFGLKVAGKRYANWMRDILKAGGEMSVGEYDGILNGFEIGQYKNGGKVYHSILGGIFPGAPGTGIGAVGQIRVIQRAYRSGARRVVSHVSSNNLPILKIHLEAGLKVKSIQHVLIRHI